MKVLDAAYPRWSPEQLKAAGVVGVCRYVGHSYWSKCITKAEYDLMLAEGIAVTLNYESDGRSWRGGYNQGVIDGRAGRFYARGTLYAPDDRPIIYSADEGVPHGMLEVLAEYMRGVNDGDSTGHPQGFYGTALAIDYLWERGLISLAWQTNARGWEGNGPDSAHAALFQRVSHSITSIPWSSYDENDVGPFPDWGQIPAPSSAAPNAAPQPPKPVPQESNVILFPGKRAKGAPGPAAANLDVASKCVILYNGARLKGDVYVPAWNLRYFPVPTKHAVIAMYETKNGIAVMDSIGKEHLIERLDSDKVYPASA